MTRETRELNKKDPLILLGVWNISPLEAWCWFDTAAIEKLHKLTGIKIRVFTHVEEELHYECVFEREINELRKNFERAKEQADYVTKMYEDFYKEVPKLENYLDKIEGKDLRRFSDSELIAAIQSFAALWTAITTQIWYAVFLDMWYPFPDEHKAVKQIAAKARDHTGHLHVRSDTTERKLYSEVAKRLSMEVKDINYLFPTEMIDALSYGTSYAGEIKERRRFCVTSSIDGEYRIYSGKKARKLFEHYQPPSVGIEAKKELRGTPACKGRVTGIIHIIRRDKDFGTFKDGEILVALQTMVHYLPIMKKSKAILTEFGGLTSHAAVVSRELKKPCIVGIPNLLASVKDGDLVEVDATAGTVNILEQ